MRKNSKLCLKLRSNPFGTDLEFGDVFCFTDFLSGFFFRVRVRGRVRVRVRVRVKVGFGDGYRVYSN